MAFTPTYDNLDSRQPWTNAIYNQLVDDLQAWTGNLDGSDFTTPTLTMAQNVDGNDYHIFGFKRWYGDGTVTHCAIRDVMAFGATGDGSTVDTTSIQNAINDLPDPAGTNPGGGIVLFPPGRYIIDAPLVMSTGTRKNVTLQGCGNATMIYLQSSSNCDMVDMTTAGSEIPGMVIKDIHFYGNAGGNDSSSAMIDVGPCLDAKILRCRFEDAHNNAINLDQSKNIVIDSCRIHGCYGHAIYAGDVGQFTYRAIITNNHIHGNHANAIYMEHPARVAIIANNNVNDNAGWGIKFHVSTSTSYYDIIIHGNYIKANGSAADKSAVDISSSVGGALSRISIANNTITENYGNGILVYGTANVSTIKDVQITGNSIYGNGAGSSGFRGIHIYSNVHHGTITGNTLKNNDGEGIYLQGAGSTGKVTFFTVTGNSCIDDQAVATQDYGIHLGSNTEDCCVIGNTVDGNVTAQISDSGTRNEIAHNPGY